MFGIPAVIIFGGLAFFSWRRGHRHGLVLLWGILFGCFLGGSLQHALELAANGGLSGLDSGLRGAVNGVSASLR